MCSLTPPSIHETPFFKVLSRAGIEHELIDLSRSDPRYAKNYAPGCQRLRASISNLQTDSIGCFVPTDDGGALPLAA
jgi:hypothetical protein